MTKLLIGESSTVRRRGRAGGCTAIIGVHSYSGSTTAANLASINRLMHHDLRSRHDVSRTLSRR